MRMRAALIAMVMTAGLSSAVAGTQAQTQPAPGGHGVTTDRVGQRPTRPAQPGPQGRGPVRDPRQPPPEGTATVKGRVVDGATGAGIPRAKVRTQGRDSRSSRIATTDAEGVFTLTKVAAGPLTLTVEKASYLAAMYPDRRRTMRLTGMTIADGQTVDNISIPLFRGGAITGRIIDAYGEPVENVAVQAIPVPQTNRSLMPPGRFFGGRAFQNSNDIGEFRVSRLEPGQYYLLAMPQRRGNDDDSGSAPGRTYYPGVISIDQAQPITLERGTSMTGIDFQLMETTLTKVSGVVLNAKGGPARGGHVSARSTSATRGAPGGWAGGMDGGGASVDQYGAFELTLQPGEYIIEGMAPQGDAMPRGGRMEMDRGQVKLMVGGESISGVTIDTGAGGGTVTGRFVFKGNSAPPTSFQGFNISFSGPNGMMGDDCRGYTRPTVNPDGTFTAEDIWGACQIRGGGNAKGWTFEAVMHSGNNITNRAIDFGAGRSVSGIEIVYTDRVGEINLTVTDERGTQTQDYVAIVFPVEKEKWGDQRFVRTQVLSGSNAAGSQVTMNRVMATASVDPSPFISTIGGLHNMLNNVLAGDYFAIAVEDAAFEDLRDPEYLARLSEMATRVTLSPGETQAVQLRRVKAPE